MEMSELQQVVPVTVVRNGRFASLGLVTYSEPDMLVFLENDRFLEKVLENSHITCVLTTSTLVDRVPIELGVAVSECPRRDFYRFHNYLAEHTTFYWQDFPTQIAEDARIASGVHIAEKNVRIGPGTIVEPGAVVMPHSIIGRDVILRPNSVIGTQGFEFKRLGNEILPVAHAGGVWLGDRVEVQACTCISRSIFGGYTTLGEDTKLDNLVHVAHNVRIGKRCLLAASAMIAGSVVIDDDVWIGPGASISSEIHIGQGASVTLGAVVTKDVAPGQRVSGNFAIDHERFITFIKTIR